jgi:hypothetical protein
MLTIKKPSAWQFVTSSTGGVGVAFLVVEGGALYLQDPAGNGVAFRYGSAGAGLSAGFKLPKIGKLQINGRGVGAGVAPAAFPNMGKLYVLNSFKNDELTISDIRGVCAFVEIGGGVVAGASGTAMLVGMNPMWLAAAMATVTLPVAGAFAQTQLANSATGLLVMGGLNAGVQAGGGIGAYLGGLY